MFDNVSSSEATVHLTKCYRLAPTSLVKRIHITKRDLFYTDVKLFVDQAESDGVLDDVATMLGCTRSNLHVVAVRDFSTIFSSLKILSQIIAHSYRVTKV